MAKTQVGLTYPRARGKHIQALNIAIDELIDAVIQCWMCNSETPFPKTHMPNSRAAMSYVWKAIHSYSGKVIKYHKY